MNSLAYTAYVSTDEILECDDFKVIYRAALYRVRDTDGAAIIRSNTKQANIVVIFHVFNTTFIYRVSDMNKNQIGFLRALFYQHGGELCWNTARLDA